MKPRPLSAARLSFPLAAAIVALLATPPVHAGQIWDGGGADNNWTTANNWDSNTLPTFTNAITFAGGTRLAPNNNRTAASTIGGINFTNTATNQFTLGGNSVTLGGPITTTAATSGSLTDTINLPVILNATRTITTNTNHNLTINGVISQSAASGLTKAGAATLTLGGANTYAGTTTIQGGTLRLANANAVGGSSGITMSTASNTLSLGVDTAMSLPGLSGSSGSFTYTIVSDRTTAGEGLTHSFSGGSFGNATFATNAGSNVTSGTAGVSFSGFLSMSGGSTGTATFAPGTADLTLPSLTATNASKTLALAGTGNGFITGVISPGSVGISAVNKSGASTWTLSGLNTFGGNVTISGGTLVAGSSGNGTNSNLGPVNNTRTINVNTGGTLRFDVPNVFHPTFSTPASSLPVLNIAGGTMTNGGTAANSALGDITLAGGTLTATTGSPIGTGQSGEGWGSWNLNGTVTSTGNSTISSTAPGGIPITLSATSTNGYVTTFDVQSGTLTASAVLGDVTRIGNETTSGLAKTGAGTMVLSGINTYTGNTAINAGILSIATTASLPGYNVNGRYSVAAGATLAVQNGVSEPEISSMLATTNFASGARLGFDTADGSRTVSAGLADTAQGPLGIVKVGANTLTLSGTNTYTGGTSVLAGSLYLGGTGSLPNWNVDGGFSVASGASLIIPNTVSEAEVTTLLGTTNVASGASLLFDTSLGDRTYASAITNSLQGQLNIGKIGTNTLTISTTSSYTGPTRVSAGTLTLAGGNSGTSGSIIVSDTAGLDATLNLTGGTYAFGSGGEIRVAFAPTTPATGTVNQSGGAVSFATSGNQLLIGNGVGIGNTGNYNLSGGSITIPAVGNRGLMLGVNTSSIANFVLSGTGILNMTTASGGSGDSTLMIGRSDSAADNTTTTFTQTGGTANVGILSIGGNGATSVGVNSTLTLTGGTFSANQFPRLAAGNSNTATINIGGTADVTLPAFPTARGTSSTATIHFDGGTLKPLAASASFMGGLSNAFIKAGGARFDTTNGSITVTQDLLTDGVSLGGGLTKAGSNTLTLTGANTYTGMTTVNAGTLTVSGAGTLSASSGLTVGNGAGFNYLPTTVGSSLAVSALNLNDGSSIGLSCDATTSSSLAASGAATIGAGVGVGINLVGTPSFGTPYTILTAASGLDTGSYVLLNPVDYYGAISASPTAVTITATASAGPLTAAYWKGGYTGFSGVWAVSNGLSGASGLSNWTTDPAGTANTALVPGVGTDVFLSAAGAAAGDQNAMTLGANMSVNSLTVNDAGSPNTNPVTLLGTDGTTLTLAAASGTGITVNAGAGAVTLAANVALGASQTWSNHSSNPLVVSGTVSGAFGLTKVGTGLVNITGATAVTSATVEAGTLYMGAPTGASITTTLGAATPVTLNGTSNLTIRRTSVGAVDLIGSIDGTGSLTLLGDNATSIASGDFTLNNASSYSGGTTITGARAAPTVGTAFGTGPVTVGASAGIFVNAGTQTFTNDFSIGGLGWNEPSGYLGALRLNGTTLSGNITLTADTRITGGGSSTLSGVISGDYGLDFFEDTVIGTITLSGENDYTGTTVVNSMGTAPSTRPNLIVSNNLALGTTEGGTIVYGTGESGGYGSRLTLANGITVTDETLTLDTLTGGLRASLVTASGGTAVWDGNVITAGTGGLAAFGADGAGSNLTVGSTAADTITGSNGLTLRGSGSGGTVHSTISIGAGGLFKTDASTWTITSNNNDFTGTVNIAQGILSVGSIAASGVNSALGAGSTILLGQNSAGANGTGTLQFTGAAGGSSNRTINITNGTTGGTGVIENTVAGQTLTLSGALTTSTPASASALTLTGAGDGVFNGGIVGTPLLTLGKTGAGSWALSNTITYTGATNVTDGTLTFDAASVFNAATPVGTFTVNGGTAVANIAGTYNVASGNGNAYFEIKGGGTLNFNGNASLGDGAAGAGIRVGEASAGTMNMTGGTMTANLSSSSNLVVGRSANANGTLNVSGGTLTVTGAGGIQIANTTTGTGVVTISGSGQLVMNSTGTVTMGTGTSTINLNTGGTFTLGSAMAASTGTSTINFDGGTLKSGLSSTTFLPAALSAVNILAGGAIIDTNGFDDTIANPLLTDLVSTGGGLTKQGAGTLTLSGANTYTGATAVNEGTLALVGGSQASPITVSSGASLGFTPGSGTTSTSSVTFNAGSTVTITGPTGAPSYTLMTATSFAGITPMLSAPVPGYELKVEGGNTLKLVSLGYASWAGLNGAGVNLDDDHDGDGVTNGVEYFLGGPNGNTTGFTALPGVVNTAGALSVTWPKGADYAGTYGTDFVVETSATLSGPWTEETIGGGNITDTPNPGGSVKYTFPGGPAYSGKNFARLKVTGP